MTRGITLALIVLIGIPAAVQATPGPPLFIHVTVNTVGRNGAVPVANVPVTACRIVEVATIDNRFCGASGLTQLDGNAYLDTYLYNIPNGTFFIGSAIIGGVTVRGIALSLYNSVTLQIDPISEAAVSILAEHAYDSEQSVALLERVRQANS